MKNKIHPQLSDNIAETLLITLMMKCRETQAKKSIFHDSKSCEIMDRLDYDFTKFGRGIMSSVGVILRAKDFDRVCQTNILNHKNPVVVILGCGLDTRYHRLAEKRNATFYELDLPEVISLRKKLLPEEKNQFYIAQSLFNEAWISELKMKHPNGNFLFLAEGVLMYFPEFLVKNFLENISKFFPGSEMYLDIISEFARRNSQKHDTVGKTNAEFRWGCDNLQELENWSRHIRLMSVFNFMVESRGRWPVIQLLMKMFPKFGKSTRNVLLRFE